MKSRIVVLFCIFISMWTLLAVRSAQLQLFPHERLLQLKERLFNKTVTLNSRRGDIIDRNGVELAVSLDSYSLYADPKLIENPKSTARKISRMLKINYSKVRKKLSKKESRFQWIKRHIDKIQYEKIKALKIRGLAFKVEPKRVYPNRRLLSQVLGFVGLQNQGLEGIELEYEDHLSGDQKRLTLHRDARGRPLLENGHIFMSNPNGGDLKLTIDRDLQFFVQDELDQAVIEHEADRAYGVVLDAQTSEILAIASTPSYDNNKALKQPTKNRRIHSSSDSFEPGSTTKALFVAGALQHDLFKANSIVDTGEGKIKIGKRTIKESDPDHKFGKITVSEVLAKSSNVGTSIMGLKMGAENVHKIMKQFGFGEKSGVELPGEARGILHKPPWNRHLLASVSFGHGMTATPLQVANAFATIANGGVLHKPRIVKAIKDPVSGEWLESDSEVRRRVIDEKIAARMRMMLTFATGQLGTGQNARVQGFPVAGKTGTAQKVNPEGGGYLRGKYISSFAGFLPANDPRFVIYIAVDNPQKYYYGSQVAAPVFSKIAAYSIRRFGIAPILVTQKNIPTPDHQVKKAQRSQKRSLEKIKDIMAEDVRVYSKMPNVYGLTLREVVRKMQGFPNEIKLTGKGHLVVSSVPQAGKDIQGRKITLIMGKDSDSKKE